MELTVATILVTFAGVFLICFMKGAFGGGFSIVGIPLLSIVMDPVTAGGLLAPLFERNRVLRFQGIRRLGGGLFRPDR